MRRSIGAESRASSVAGDEAPQSGGGPLERPPPRREAEAAVRGQGRLLAGGHPHLPRGAAVADLLDPPPRLGRDHPAKRRSWPPSSRISASRGRRPADASGGTAPSAPVLPARWTRVVSTSPPLSEAAAIAAVCLPASAAAAPLFPWTSRPGCRGSPRSGSVTGRLWRGLAPASRRGAGSGSRRRRSATAARRGAGSAGRCRGATRRGWRPGSRTARASAVPAWLRRRDQRRQGRPQSGTQGGRVCATWQGRALSALDCGMILASRACSKRLLKRSTHPTFSLLCSKMPADIIDFRDSRIPRMIASSTRRKGTLWPV